MENNIERLRQAKMFIEYLASGIDPVTNTDADAGTLHNEEIRSCFRFISEILAWEIYNADTGDSAAPDFYITEEQSAALRTFAYNCKVRELAGEINRVTESNGTKKMSATWINDWLEAEGYLYRSNFKNRVASEKGKALGITTERREKENGIDYYMNLHSPESQSFIYGHIADILAYKKEYDSQNAPAPDIVPLECPYDIPIRDFISRQQDKCFILTVGSCNSAAGLGSYRSALLFKGRSKVLKKSDIQTTHATDCIMSGILDAASAIKSPTDVVILTSSPLAFNAPKNKYYKSCTEICNILNSKGCKIFVSACQGRGRELNEIVKSL